MDSEVYQETQSSQLASAMQHYKIVSDGYVRLVRLALRLPADKRLVALDTIEQENKRLQRIVERMLQMWQADKAQLTEYGKYKISELRKILEEYKRQLEELGNAQDELVKLQVLNQSLSNQTIQDRTIYFGYIIACLVLLVLVFVLFVYTSFSSTSRSMFTATSPPVLETL
jgi:acetoin utilization deacetylase AcuC-like enzyme